jgi:hypothetical protein
MSFSQKRLIVLAAAAANDTAAEPAKGSINRSASLGNSPKMTGAK